MKILFKDQLGNRIIERSNGDIGLKNREGEYCRDIDFREFVKEHKLGNKIRFREGENLWVHNNFLS